MGPGGTALPGAAVFDPETGERLNEDRGPVRASHLDYSPAGREAACRALAEHGLSHFRTLEALAVASKVVWSGVAAELCWSDDPDYAAGYVATARSGYVRFPRFKPGGAAGGRVFFIASSRARDPEWRLRLERRCVLVAPPVVVHPPVTVEQFLGGFGS
jgi:6-carboxyhexanoate--CoA ligase